MIFKQDAQVDWHRSAHDIAQHIRGVTPAPGAHTPLKEGSLKIHRVRTLTPEEFQTHTQSLDSLPPPGTFLGEGKDGPIVMCQSGALVLLEVQKPSRKVIRGVDYCRGHSLQVGHPLL